MKKITYKTSNLFTLKKYNDSNLNCTSYLYPTIYGIRCAILGAVIQVDGLEKAKELFYKIKNTNIYVQMPKENKVNKILLKRYSNNSYGVKDCKYDLSKIYNRSFSTMGSREYVDLENIVFYIDNLIPNIEMYLKNIDWLGTAESLVYLDNIEDTSTLENVLLKHTDEEVYIYEQADWSTKTTFDTVYKYSEKKYKHTGEKYMCKVDDLML